MESILVEVSAPVDREGSDMLVQDAFTRVLKYHFIGGINYRVDQRYTAYKGSL